MAVLFSRMDNTMNFALITQNDIRLVYCQPGTLIRTYEDIVDLLALCGENLTDRILIGQENLPEEFYNLRTGLAGSILGKFSTYRILAGFHIPPEKMIAGRFGEMVLELNRGREIHFSANQDELIRWLTTD